MKAVYKPRIVDDNRSVLHEVLPLETPFTVNIDIASVCNFRCNFCYHSGAKQIPRQLMEKPVFFKAIDDLRDFKGDIKTVRLYKEGEPLLNKNIVEFVKYAKQSPKVKRVDFTTNGFFLSEEITTKLVDAGLDRIIISIEGMSDEAYLQTTGVAVSFKEMLNKVKFFYENKGNCKLHVKTTDTCLKDDGAEKFFDVFGDICDEIFIEQVSPFWPDFSLDSIKKVFEVNTHGNMLKSCLVCPVIFSSLTVNSDGSVDLCVADWERRCILGSIKTDSLYNIWNSAKLNDIYIAHLEKKRLEMDLCKSCNYPNFTTFDHIDDYAEKLLQDFYERREKYEKKS